MNFRTVAVVALVAALATAASAEVVFRSEHAPESAWQWQHRCAPDDIVNLVFAVRQKNTEALTARLEVVSDPTHPAYTEYMTFEELGQLTRDDDALRTVTEWLKPHASVVDTTLNGDFVTARLVAEKAEMLFTAEFHAYKHRDTGKVVFRASSARMPDEIAAAVEYTARLVDFPRPRPLKISFVPALNTALGTPNGTATPPVIQKFYGMPTDAQKAAEGDAPALAIFEALGQQMSPTDLANFQKQWNLGSNPAGAGSVGKNTPISCLLQPGNCEEFQLDADVVSMSMGLPWIYWSIDGSDETPFVDWAVGMANATNPPLVTSISYGGPEGGEPLALQQRFATEMQKLGVRGRTVVISSGDDGANGSGARQSPSGCAAPGNGFSASFPATVPWVTSVGATMGPETGSPEVACASDNGGLITTGGGFSTIFARPAFQDASVEAYLNNGTAVPPTTVFNASGHAYPHVALMGHNYEILINGQVGIGSGTSASSPLFATMVALVNNQRLLAGKKPLGFVSPALFQQVVSNPQVFNDITSGDNKCAAGPAGHEDCCTYGFTAGPGFDPVTGLGSINFPEFAKVFGAL